MVLEFNSRFNSCTTRDCSDFYLLFQSISQLFSAYQLCSNPSFNRNYLPGYSATVRFFYSFCCNRSRVLAKMVNLEYELCTCFNFKNSRFCFCNQHHNCTVGSACGSHSIFHCILFQKKVFSSDNSFGVCLAILSLLCIPSV